VNVNDRVRVFFGGAEDIEQIYLLICTRSSFDLFRYPPLGSSYCLFVFTYAGVGFESVSVTPH
jgi:hypothetical protein